MEFDFDPAKNAANRLKHGLSFADFIGFDAPMIVRIDDRLDYGETRYRGFGRIAGRGYCIIYTQRGDTARIISFRRMHEKEMRRYE